MQTRARWLFWSFSLMCVIGAASLCILNAADDDKKPPKDPELERARKTVKMLDDVYKTTIVLITDKYVNDERDFPAGSAAIALFSDISKKGWHQVRLLDATGDPVGKNNVARDDFEKEAVKQLKSGKPYFEQIVTREGKRHLRAATPVPVVMKKCIMCHPQYEDVKAGAPIGALAYELALE